MINAIKKKISREEDCRGGTILNNVVKEGHIQKGIFEANHISINRYQARTADNFRRREQLVPSTGHV